MRNSPCFVMLIAALLLVGSGCQDEDNNTTEGDTTTKVADTSTTDMTTAEDSSAEDAEPETTVVGEDFAATEADFRCLTEWTKVRRFRVENTLGYLDDALAVANNPEGGTYPVGTIIQLVPLEAMVKRGQGFSEATNDWEFFSLTANSDGSTTIQKRGTTDVTNFFGGNCFDCHAKAEPQWDMICEQDHGCDPLGIDAEFIDNAQNNDPRCSP